jgi:hypothetical protein
MVLVLLFAIPAVHAADEAVGCYSVTMTKAGADGKGSKRVETMPLRLSDKKANLSWSDEPSIVPVVPGDDFGLPGVWMHANDRLDITFSNTGLSGDRMRLHAVTGGFDGTFEEFWDFRGSDVKGQVSLRKQPCSSFQKRGRTGRTKP